MKLIVILISFAILSSCSSIDLSGLYDDTIGKVTGLKEKKKDPSKLGNLVHSYKAGDNLVCVYEYGSKISNDEVGCPI